MDRTLRFEIIFNENKGKQLSWWFVFCSEESEVEEG